MCEHMVEKFSDKDAKKGDVGNRMEFRKKSNETCAFLLIRTPLIT